MLIHWFCVDIPVIQDGGIGSNTPQLMEVDASEDESSQGSKEKENLHQGICNKFSSVEVQSFDPL